MNKQRIFDLAELCSNKCKNYACPMGSQQCPLSIHACYDATEEDWLNIFSKNTNLLEHLIRRFC